MMVNAVYTSQCCNMVSSTCDYVNFCRDICVEMKENIVAMWLIALDSSNVTLHV